MMLSLQRQLHDAIADAVRRELGVDDVPAVFRRGAAEPRDWATWPSPSRFSWRASCKKPPRAIAQQLAPAIQADPRRRARRRRAERLPQRVPRPAAISARAAPRRGRARSGSRPTKTIVEHTAINPNKAAHIGHLRNAALGDTLVRALAFRGTPVEVQNYIDDTGVQVADVIVGFRELEHRSLDEVRHIADTTRFDYYCWDLYSRVTEWYAGDKERLAIRAAALHDLEQAAATTPPRSARSSSIASSARIWRRWSG